ncbi:MAG: 4Fe-4S ferredoxin [Bacteroidetes bacterium]|nr:4Fe-4S ferredoxin [Bacteroidota bacterium]
MKRKIIQIDEEKCNGCGLCVPNCQEGALQIIDGKARLISDLFCDGLGACIGHCPEGAIEIIEREAEPYDERKVMEVIVPKGRNTILAHLEHLRDHNEKEYLNQAIAYLKEHHVDMSPGKGHDSEVVKTFHESLQKAREAVIGTSGCGGGCPGSQAVSFGDHPAKAEPAKHSNDPVKAPSELRQWPVQLHLLHPAAAYFKGADVLLAADCAAFAMGNFHDRFMKGRSIAIACPKLDSNKESYVEKLTAMIRDSQIKSLTVVMMEVPCCGGLHQMAMMARQQAGKQIPINKMIVSLQGEVIREEVV